MEYGKGNVLLFTLEYPPFKGGVANVYGNVVKHWNSEIFVLTGDRLLKPHWFFALWHLYRAVKKHNIRTILVGHILPLGTVTCWLAKFMSVRYVVFLHGMDFAQALKAGRKRRLARRILARAERIIAMNGYTAALVQREFGNVIGTKVVVVNPGVTFTKQENNPTLRRAGKTTKQLLEKYHLEGKKILLQVGRLVERKGYDKVLEALPAVIKEIQNLMYVIVGDGPQREALQIINQKSSIKNHVIFITNATDEEVEFWYELCDIFIMPARNIDGDFEGFGIVYLEAGVYGQPVIAGGSGGGRDAGKKDLNGLLVNPESTPDIKDAILKLYHDEFLRRRLGQRGREWAKSFAWEDKVSQIKKIVL